MRKIITAVVLSLSIMALPVRSEAHGIEPIIWGMHHMHHIVGHIGKGQYIEAALPGFIIVGAIATLIAIKAPAWDEAKDTHTEKAYQQKEQWPQQWFDTLPGGTPGRLNPAN